METRWLILLVLLALLFLSCNLTPFLFPSRFTSVKNMSIILILQVILTLIYIFLHRCADLLSEVLKVLQSVGVSCCTIQPEFASCSGPSITQSEEVSRPHRPTCSLACPVACAASVCCSPSEVETIPPPAAAALQESQLTDLGNWGVASDCVSYEASPKILHQPHYYNCSRSTYEN